ncbi:hypothetical protein P43SY_004216 [Pythium insidiosum]|uniref:Uncharacterized protein n=1 Tax=Pythium insidiosum TaxID=114742 RepID=A0AAD5M0W3_PYTIN|nr:hypothetical protein P43SY_004216 [Pythium insidiosum]
MASVSSRPARGKAPSSPTPPPHAARKVVLQSTLHLSPRKFHRLQQQQRNAVLRGMLPLSPLSPRRQQQQQPNDDAVKPTPTFAAPSVVERCDPVPWNPAWLPVAVETAVLPAVAMIPPSMAGLTESTLPALSAAQRPSAQGVSYASMSLDSWLHRFEQDVLQFESLEAFAQVKVAEALAFCEQMELHIEEQAMLEAGQPVRPTAATTAHAAGASAPTVAPPLTATARFPARFRIAVFASLVERAVLALTQSAALGHLKPLLLQARQELFRAIFVDYDPPLPSERRRKRTQSTDGLQQDSSSSSSSDDNGQEDDDEEDLEDDENEAHDVDTTIGISSAQRRSSRLEFRRQQRIAQQRSRRRMMQHPSVRLGPDTPRTLGFFLSRIPFALKLQEDTQRRAVRFQRHQVVMRRIVQSMFRSLGSVFHAWKIHVRQKREERLNEKGAQLTAMVVMQRGLVRTLFVEWSKVTLKAKLRKMQDREMDVKQKHDERINALHKELFVLREQNNQLHEQLRIARGELLAPPTQHDKQSEDDEEEVDDISAVQERLRQLESASVSELPTTDATQTSTPSDDSSLHGNNSLAT